MAKNILHMFSPLKHMSPFDVNMALDAGYDSVTPYIFVTLEDVTALVQDAMFSRSPKDAVRTAVFIGGKDAGLALDMMERFRATLLKPFEISAFADPAGSFTTAAAMVACVEKQLRKKKDKSLAKTKILIFGATGVVGYAAAVISALEGADVTLAGHDGPERVQEKAEDIKRRFGVDVRAIDTSTEEKKIAALAGVERPSRRGEIPAHRRRRQRRAAGRHRRPRTSRQRRGAHRRRARRRAARHRRREIQDRIRPVPPHGRRAQAFEPRFPRRFRAGPGACLIQNRSGPAARF